MLRNKNVESKFLNYTSKEDGLQIHPDEGALRVMREELSRIAAEAEYSIAEC